MIGNSRSSAIKGWLDGTLTADGSEQLLFSTDEICATAMLLVNVDNMDVGDSISIRTYIRMKSGGGWILVDADTYADADGGLVDGLLADEGVPASPYGARFTLEQTAGTNRDYDWLLVEWAA